MKFVQLKKSLSEKIYPAYMLYGEDVFLLYKSLDMLTKRLITDFEEMNKIIFSENAPFTLDDILSAAQGFPMMNDYKMIIVRDAKIKSTKENIEKLKNYLENPNETSVLVFFHKEKNEFFDAVKNICEGVDCEKLDDANIIKWIDAVLAKNSKTMESFAKRILIDYCNSDMARISSETEKLMHFTGNRTVLTADDVELNVAKEKDYAAYELADYIIKKNKKMALEVLQSFFAKNDANASASIVLSNLYAAYSRLLFVKISAMNDAELAKILKVKEFAVKKAKALAADFTAAKLKDCCFAISEVELAFKSGKLPAENAAVNLIYRLLQ